MTEMRTPVRQPTPLADAGTRSAPSNGSTPRELPSVESLIQVPVGNDPLMPTGSGEGGAPPPVDFGRLGGHALYFTGASIISGFVSFLMLPLYTRFLTTTDYGAIELVELSLDVLTILAGSRLLGGVLRFYYKARTERDRRAVISTSLWMVCVGYALIGALAFVGAPLIAREVLGSDRYTLLVRLGALAAATSAPTFVPTPLFRIQERFRLLVSVQLVRLAIQVALNVVLLVKFRLGAESMFLSTITANVLTGSVLVVLAVRQVGARYAPSVASDLFRFGVPLVVTHVATFILTFGDRPFLRAAATLAGVGVYSVSYKFAFLLQNLGQSPFETVYDPKRYEVASQPRTDRDAVYGRMFVYINCVLLTMAVGIAVFVRSALQLLTTSSYWPAANVVPVLLAAMILQAWAAAQDIGIGISERTKWVAIANWTSTAVVLGMYALLIPRYGAWGAAWATVIGYSVRYVAIYSASQRLWPVTYRWRPVLTLTGVAAATIAVGILLPRGPLALAIVLRVVLFVTYIIVAWRLPILNQNEREAVWRFAALGLERLAALLRRDVTASVASSS
jgi:O-antigen/teichoic acid export membrane protein